MKGEEQKPYNAADEEQVKSRKEKQKRRDLLKRTALRQFLGGADGRMWMWDLLEKLEIFSSGFSSDALVMAFKAGQRDAGLKLIAEINRLDGGLEIYMRMAKENQG